MKRCNLLLLGFVFLSAGCTDNIDSVSREYRATTNEGIDALMMITTEAHAERMTIRVLKPMSTRYQEIDKKLEIVRNNREKVDFVREMFESDGLQLYLTDLEVNRQRYGLEIVRLRNLYQQYQAREKELLIEFGEKDPQFNPRDVCPFLHDLLYKPDVLETMRTQLTNPPLVGLLSQMPQWKTKNYDESYKKFEQRRATFLPAGGQRRIILVQ